MVWWLAPPHCRLTKLTQFGSHSLNNNQLSPNNNNNLLEFEPLHQLILSLSALFNSNSLSLDRRAPVERRSGHYQRLEEKRKKEEEEKRESEK